jgi:hypothetical protein
VVTELEAAGALDQVTVPVVAGSPLASTPSPLRS